MKGEKVLNANTIAKGIEIVGFLFVAFGGFLTGIAPPEMADARFAVGVSSFLALILLFVFAALSKRHSQERFRTYWIGAAVVLFVLSIATAFVYKSKYDSLTFKFPPNSTKVEYIAGTELTPQAQSYKQQNPGITKSELLDDFEGPKNIEKVWTEESIRKAKMYLTGSYVALVLSLLGAIFALTEGTLAGPQRKIEKRQRK